MNLRRLLCFCLSLQLALFPGLSYGNSSLVPDQKILEQLSAYGPDDAENAAENAKSFLSLPTQNILEINFLLKKLYEKVDKATQRTGLVAMAEKLALRKDSDSISWEETGVGKAELIVVGQGEKSRFLTKVRHNGLKATILFVDRHQLDLEAVEEKPASSLTPDQYKAELELRQYLAAQWRGLLARVIMSEWNPEYTYKPLPDRQNKTPELSKAASPLTPLPTTSAEAETSFEQQIHDLENLTAQELSKKSWYQRLKSNWYELAIASEQVANIEASKETMVVFYDSEESRILSAERHRPYDYKNESLLSKKRYVKHLEYVITWWRSIYEPPAYNEAVWKNSKGLGKLRVLVTGDYLMGLGFGFTLSSLTYGVALMVPSSLPEGISAFNVAQISFLWSVFFGVFSKSWQNFVYRGSEFSRFCKNWITGLGQSYHFNLISDESLWLMKDGRIDAEAAKIHTDIIINQTIKNYSKTAMQELPRFRSKTGEASGTLKIRDYKFVMPGNHNPAFLSMETHDQVVETEVAQKRVQKRVLGFLEPIEHDTMIPRANFEGQLVQLVSTPVSLLSRFGWTVFNIPVGHLLYLALGPIGEYAGVRYKTTYAKQLQTSLGADHPLTVRMQNLADEELANWRKLRVLNIPYTSPVGFYAKVLPKSVWNTSKRIATWGIERLAHTSYKVIYGQIELPAEAQAKLTPAEELPKAQKQPSFKLRCEALFKRKK